MPNEPDDELQNEPSTLAENDPSKRTTCKSRQKNPEHIGGDIEDTIDGNSMFIEDSFIATTQEESQVTVRETKGPGRSLEREVSQNK